MYEITVPVTLSSSHWLRDYPGKCQRPHGHNFDIFLSVRGEHLNSLGMLVDFSDLKAQLESLVEEQFDHYMLNERPPFTEVNPTAENLAQYIFYLPWILPSTVQISKVTVYETEDNCASYQVSERL